MNSLRSKLIDAGFEVSEEQEEQEAPQTIELKDSYTYAEAFEAIQDITLEGKKHGQGFTDEERNLVCGIIEKLPLVRKSTPIADVRVLVEVLKDAVEIAPEDFIPERYLLEEFRELGVQERYMCTSHLRWEQLAQSVGLDIPDDIPEGKMLNMLESEYHLLLVSEQEKLSKFKEAHATRNSDKAKMFADLCEECIKHLD